MKLLIFRSKVYNRSTNLKNVIYSVSPEDLTIDERIEYARPLIFNFNYETPSNVDTEQFKQELETMFIDRYIILYFGVPTFEQFQLKLKSLFQSKMKTYSKKFEALADVQIESFTLDSTGETTAHSTASSDTANKSSATNSSVNSKFPQSIINARKDLGAVKHANDGNLTENINTADSVNSSKSDNKTTYKNYKGNSFESVIKFKEAFDKVYDEFLDEFLPLFDFMM